MRQVVTVDKTSYLETAKAAARAFTYDPLIVKLLAGLTPEVRTRRSINFFIPYYRACCQMGLPLQVVEDNQVVGGACLWPPGNIPLPSWVIMRVVLESYLRNRFRFTGLFTFYQWSSFVEKKHPKTPHYYVDFLGVAPPWQNRGLGSSILEYIIRQADLEQIGCYLESTNPRNLSLYQRFGFQILSQADVVVPTWFLWREPA